VPRHPTPPRATAISGKEPLGKESALRQPAAAEIPRRRSEGANPASRGGCEMWWEWEGGGEEAAREETPVDFDFISLLAKPKVRRKRHPSPVLPSILPPDFELRR